tara:strand:+ start:2108 stop:2725 length:618 start_codon:yes stop_codon:yes gene_type:complete
MPIESFVMSKKTSKKEAKKTTKKSISDAALKKINRKLISTKNALENQVEDLSLQVKKLGKKSGKKALKLFNELDANYHRKLVDLQDEFEERLASLSSMQDKVVELMTEKVTTTKSATAKLSKPVKPTKTKPKSTPQPKAAIKTATIASINSIGPVMQKKLAEKGITTLDDIANTPKDKIQILKQFENERGFSTWEGQAKTLLADS